MDIPFTASNDSRYAGTLNYGNYIPTAQYNILGFRTVQNSTNLRLTELSDQDNIIATATEANLSSGVKLNGTITYRIA